MSVLIKSLENAQWLKVREALSDLTGNNVNPLNQGFSVQRICRYLNNDDFLQANQKTDMFVGHASGYIAMVEDAANYTELNFWTRKSSTSNILYSYSSLPAGVDYNGPSLVPFEHNQVLFNWFSHSDVGDGQEWNLFLDGYHIRLL